MQPKKFILCNCGAEILLCQNSNDDLKSFFFTIFKSGQFNPKPNLIERLRYGFWHVWTGKKYEDEIIMKYSDSKKLAKWILKEIKCQHNKRNFQHDQI